MKETIGAVAAVITAIGFGGVLGALVKHWLDSRRSIGEKEHELKERRYLCILLLMLGKLKPEIGIARIRQTRPDLHDLAALDSELESELFNAVIFASSSVLRTFGEFLTKPSEHTFAHVAAAMRSDLWGGRKGSDANLVEMLSTLTSRRQPQPLSEVTAEQGVAPDGRPQTSARR
jgi:hypothetical protein